MPNYIATLLVIICSISQITCESKLNRLELETFKYDLDIEKNLISDESDFDWTRSMLMIRTSNGQEYVCKLPENEDVALNGVDPNEFEAPDFTNESEFSLLSIFFEKSYSIFNQKKLAKPQINFTLVNENIQTQMQRLNELNLCISKVCF